jgi:hypothetical protein
VRLRISQECLDHPAHRVEFLINHLVDFIVIKFKILEWGGGMLLTYRIWWAVVHPHKAACSSEILS